MTGTRRICILLSLIVTLIPLNASAQLGFTQYVEYTSIQVGGLQASEAGANIHLGDDLHTSIPGGAASITFDTPNTPDWMRVSASLGSSASSARVESFGDINFKFQLNQISNPPVAISTVPVSVTSSGWASASSSGFNVSVDSHCSLVLMGDTAVQVSLEAAVNLPNSSSDAFSETVYFQPTPTEIVTVSMSAQVIINGYLEGPGVMDGQGDAYIDPVFTVSDELIPGTSTRYDEVYEVRFSTGWDDVTGGVPISSTKSVGKLKGQFRD